MKASSLHPCPFALLLFTLTISKLLLLAKSLEGVCLGSQNLYITDFTPPKVISLIFFLVTALIFVLELHSHTHTHAKVSV